MYKNFRKYEKTFISGSYAGTACRANPHAKQSEARNMGIKQAGSRIFTAKYRIFFFDSSCKERRYGMKNNPEQNSKASSREEGLGGGIPPRYKKPFDPDLNTPEEILFNCGKYGLPPENAIGILRRSSNVETRHASSLIPAALKDPSSPENRWYAEGMAAGEAEIAAALHQNVVDAGKDAYKSFSAENRRKAINRSISKNFGLDEEN